MRTATHTSIEHGIRRPAQAGLISFRLLVLAAMLGALAAILFARSRQQATTGTQSPSFATDAEALAAATQTAPSRSPFEIVAQAREAAGPYRPPPPPGPWSLNVPQQIAASVALALTAVLLVRKMRTRIASFPNPSPETNPSHADAAMAAERQDLAAFVENFEIGKAPPQPDANASTSHSPNPEVLAEFFAAARSQLESARSIYSEIGRAGDLTKRQELLRKLYELMHSLKGSAGAPGLMPVWVLAAATESLLGQLAEKPSNVTPSTLRTVAGALLLLDTLCVQQVRPDLADSPPVRLLAADDDAISRRAVSLALNKHLRMPDVAENGTQALELAAQKSYDVIFLDVEMPDIDGFEVCSRIRHTPENRGAPIVFVTGHSDFDSRTRSFASGGQDLIAKPFLSSEVTVKALTWVLRGRLDKQNRPAVTTIPESAHKQTAKEQSLSRAAAPAKPASNGGSLPLKSGSLVASPIDEFKYHAREEMFSCRDSLRNLSGEADAAAQDLLGAIYIKLRAMTVDADRLGAKSFVCVAEGTCNLLRKVLEKPQSITPSLPHTLDNALRALEALSAPDASHFPTAAPVRVLVVDDDAVARRAMSNALQLCYTRPDTAESGEVAVQLGGQSEFDVIFMDVVMPGIGGFETVAQVRAGTVNQNTPVIFVTSHTDAESRAQAAACGGSSFICKPVLPAEIALVALTARFARVSATNPDRIRPSP